MSSSCVPPKGSCVLHDPDPEGQDDDRENDSDSECGSLCTCTSSSSMTSIANATSIPNGRSGRSAGSYASLIQQQSQQQQSLSMPTSGGNTQDTNGNPYFVVFVPPALLPGRSRSCGNCHGFSTLGAAFSEYLLTACEFCPWVAGFVFIYYSFSWWGIGPGFTAFLFMMGTHAFIRFLRTKGDTSCGIGRAQNHRNTEEENDEDENDGNSNNNNNEVGSGDAPPDVVNESPPSYEAAVGKPPPYDLYHHLTPTQPRSSPPQQVTKQNINENFLSVADFPQKAPRNSLDICDEDDDVFLPSYQDALRLSFRSEKEVEHPLDDKEES